MMRFKPAGLTPRAPHKFTFSFARTSKLAAERFVFHL